MGRCLPALRHQLVPTHIQICMGRYGEIARKLMRVGPEGQGEGLIEPIADTLPIHSCLIMTQTRLHAAFILGSQLHQLLLRYEYLIHIVCKEKPADTRSARAASLRRSIAEILRFPKTPQIRFYRISGIL
ncbi:hypothetical protein Y032_0081g1496 [Ancylostoma ceylanicum]|uniref:Uncharacterized protein n=1 Tax=Ancylostoma ceylanicum TaxID=53326 RepID=A0A016TRJ4_9BILA|nr:hypothetical protein Y032_0081g1496 [Ancylostoma ceylanicum]